MPYEIARRTEVLISEKRMVAALIRFIEREADADHVAYIAQECFGGKFFSEGGSYRLYVDKHYGGEFGAVDASQKLS
jgi:hypothetical protein